MGIALLSVGCDDQSHVTKSESDTKTDQSRIGYGRSEPTSELDEPPDWDQFLADIMAAPQNERQAMADSFITLLEDSEDYGFPLTVEKQCVYLFTSSYSAVQVPGDHNEWTPSDDPMTLIAGTNLFYRERTFEQDARLDYKFVTPGNNWILDPRNPRQVTGGCGPNSELAMPEYVDPWEIDYNPDIPHGTLETFQFTSDSLNNTRGVKVYLPAGYDPEGAYPAIYVHDGGEYVSLASMKNTLDNLIDAELINPVIAVFVNPIDRMTEYWLNEPFMWMFVNELVPYIDATYPTDPQPASRAVMGCSLGGLTSVYFAHNHPDVFGYAGGHSSAVYVNNNELINDIAADDPTEVVYYLDAGTYEASIYQSSTALKDALEGKGNNVTWQVWHEGHSWGAWRAHTDNILQTFFSTSGVKE